jgi:polyhydroxyalkanoate synthesis regulator phasin
MDGDKQPKLKELERAVEEAVKKALSKVKMPRREDVQALNARIDKLAERVEALSK